jgi:DNA-binding transcriptional regulator YhcF (GntR family)
MAKGDFDIFFEHPEEDSLLKMRKEEKEFYQKAFSKAVIDAEEGGYNKEDIRETLESDRDFKSAKTSLSKAKKQRMSTR